MSSSHPVEPDTDIVGRQEKHALDGEFNYNYKNSVHIFVSNSKLSGGFSFSFYSDLTPAIARWIVSSFAAKAPESKTLLPQVKHSQWRGSTRR